MKVQKPGKLNGRLFPTFKLPREQQIGLALILNGLDKHLAVKTIDPKTGEVTFVIKLPGLLNLKKQLEKAGYTVKIEAPL